MPKISKKTIRCGPSTAPGIFEIEVMYNQDELFYITLPKRLNAAYDIADKKKKNELGGYERNTNRRSDMYGTKDFIRLVNASSEKLVLEKMEKLITYLMTQQTIVRDVIVIFFVENHSHYSGRIHNEKHPEIGMQYGLFYGRETKVGKDGKPYYQSVNKEGNIDRRNDGMWSENSFVVIDDTTENRLFVENIYTALGVLINRLKLCTKTTEAMIELIGSKQRLIG